MSLQARQELVSRLVFQRDSQKSDLLTRALRRPTLSPCCSTSRVSMTWKSRPSSPTTAINCILGSLPLERLVCGLLAHLQQKTPSILRRWVSGFSRLPALLRQCPGRTSGGRGWFSIHSSQPLGGWTYGIPGLMARTMFIWEANKENHGRIVLTSRPYASKRMMGSLT